MKTLFLAVLFATVFSLAACDNSHVTANVPPKDDFRPFLIRDLSTYFQRTYGNGITVDYELLRDVPTQVGVAYPKFYIWATVTKPDKSVVDGAASTSLQSAQRQALATSADRHLVSH